MFYFEIWFFSVILGYHFFSFFQKNEDLPPNNETKYGMIDMNKT